MDILHIKNTAGVGTQLRDAQRRLGHKSDILVFNVGDKQYDFDYVYSNDWLERIPVPGLAHGVQLITNIAEFRSLIDDYELLHFHGYTIVGADVAPSTPPQGLDLPLWKASNKKLIKHHHGTDIKNQNCPYFQKKYADLRLASTPDLLHWDPEAKLVLNPIIPDNYEYVGVEKKNTDETIKIVHASTNRKGKGTKKLINAVQKVQDEGIDVEIQIIENTPNEKAIEIYKNADIIADQFKNGWYGMFTIEAMALGKPVLVYINEKYKRYAPDPPVVNTPIDEIADHIAMLADDYEYRYELGRRAREFVEEHHDAESTSERILSMVKSEVSH